VLIVIHSGQTGVERGAHRAAVAHGIQLAGFMPLDRRDELGPIPADVAQHLTPCFDRGPRPAIRANVTLASGVLLVVPEKTHPGKFTAMQAVMNAVRAAHAPSLVIDPTSDLEEVAKWAHGLAESSGSVRLLVTGPRGTRWLEGESITLRFLSAIALT
jgi:hypothetical protein